MGMFDYVCSEIALPDGWGGELQSKDFDCEMTLIVIRANGRLEIERFEQEVVPLEERPYPDAPAGSIRRLAGMLRRINRRWEDLNFHGDFNFYGSEGRHGTPDYKWHDYIARFSNGQLDWIRDTNAQGMEARQGGDEGSVHDSPVAESDAPCPACDTSGRCTFACEYVQ